MYLWQIWSLDHFPNNAQRQLGSGHCRKGCSYLAARKSQDPTKKSPSGRLWLNDGSCMRLSANYPHHVWSYDFVKIGDTYGGKIRMFTMIHEYTKRYLTIHCTRRIGTVQVNEQLVNTIILHGILEYIRSDNGPEFIDKELRTWLSTVGVKTDYITLGSPWEDGFCESYNGIFRDNLMDGEIFYSPQETKMIVE